MAHCIIPLRVTKVGGLLKYDSKTGTKNRGIEYTVTYEDALKQSDIKLISNESLYGEIKDIVKLFSNQNIPIKLTSDDTEPKGIFYVEIGALKKYYTAALCETLNSFQQPPKIVQRVDVRASFIHADIDEKLKKTDSIAVHYTNHLEAAHKIANITKGGNNPFSINGYLVEFSTCPKCSDDGSFKSGLFLSVDISNEVSDQEKQLENYAQKIFEDLKKQGFTWSPTHR